MTRTKSIYLALIAVLMSPVAANADVITTLFASNNNGGPGGAVYFDLTVGLSDIEITGLETNTHDLSGSPPVPGFEFWILTGTFAGNEQNSGAWTQVTTGSVTPLGANNASLVSLLSNVILSANTTYGISFVMPSTIRHYYTNGDGSNQIYADSNLSLSFGSASNTPFGTPTFNPRVWNGSIIYNVASVPEPGTLALLGIGLVGMGLSRRRKKA